MKLYITLTICIFCFCGCFGGSSPEISSEQLQANSIAPSSNSVVNYSEREDPAPTPQKKALYRPKAGDIKIDTYRNGILETTEFYRHGKCIKFLSYDPDTKEVVTEIEYLYKKNGEIDRQNVLVSKYFDPTDGEPMAEESKRAEEDFEYQRDFLKSKGIEFPISDLVANDISDIAETLGAGDDYPDFKREVSFNSGRKTIKFIGFNKTGRYHHSPMNLVININGDPIGDFLNIKDYELVLKNKYPSKEIYKLDVGTVTKTFSYKNGNLTDITYEFIGLKNDLHKESVHFEYEVVK